MLSNSTRRAPAPPPIHIHEIRQRRHGEKRLQTAAPTISPPPPTSPLSKAIPALGPFPQTTTTLPTSLRLSSPTSQTTIVARTTTHLSTFTTTIQQSPTRTSFVTVIQTQSLFSPNDKGEKSPDDTKTVFVPVSGDPQFVTVTVGPAGSTGTTLPSADTAQNVTGGVNLLPRGAIAPLVSLSIIAGVSAIITVVVILWRRRKKKMDKEAGNVQRAMTQEGDGGFRAIPDTRPILS